jgi:hypothetical protein
VPADIAKRIVEELVIKPLKTSQENGKMMK